MLSFQWPATDAHLENDIPDSIRVDGHARAKLIAAVCLARRLSGHAQHQADEAEGDGSAREMHFSRCGCLCGCLCGFLKGLEERCVRFIAFRNPSLVARHLLRVQGCSRFRASTCPPSRFALPKSTGTASLIQTGGKLGQQVNCSSMSSRRCAQLSGSSPSLGGRKDLPELK